MPSVSEEELGCKPASRLYCKTHSLEKLPSFQCEIVSNDQMKRQSMSILMTFPDEKSDNEVVHTDLIEGKDMGCLRRIPKTQSWLQFQSNNLRHYLHDFFARNRKQKYISWSMMGDDHCLSIKTGWKEDIICWRLHRPLSCRREFNLTQMQV